MPESHDESSAHLDQPLGKIEVSLGVIASLAGWAVSQCYGVVGMAPQRLKDGIAEILHQEDYHRGVKVWREDGGIIIELFVVIEYGTRISEVARNIMSTVKFTVEKALGVTVAQVNVNVQDLRVSNEN